MDEDRFRYPGWRVVGACAVSTFFATLPLNTFAVFLRPVCETFHWSRDAAASAFAMLTLMALATTAMTDGTLPAFNRGCVFWQPARVPSLSPSRPPPPQDVTVTHRYSAIRCSEMLP